MRPRPDPGPPSGPALWALPATMAVAALLLAVAGWNEALFIALNRLAGYGGDTLWAALTVLGDGLVVLALALPLVWRRARLLYALVVAALIATLLVQGFKALAVQPRPAAVLDDIQAVGPLHTRGSFPSGHAAAISVLVAGVVLGSHRGRRWAVALVPLMLAVAFSRVVVGVHWPVDVLVAVALGWLMAGLGLRIATRWPVGAGRRAQQGFAVLLTPCALLLPWHDTGYPQAWWLQCLLAVAVLALAAPSLARLFRP